MSHRTRLRQLRALYSEIPDVHCKGLCQSSCGSIIMNVLELGQLERFSGRVLHVIRPGRPCSFLDDRGRCSGYEGRPMICRLFGAVEKMRCPEGCVPDRWLSDEDAARLLNRARAIGGGLVSNSPTLANMVLGEAASEGLHREGLSEADPRDPL